MARFQYCLNASTIRTTPVLTQIEAAAAAGFTAIELWHDHLDEHLRRGGTLTEVRNKLDAAGITVPTTIYLAGWFQPSGPEHLLALDEVRRRLEQAAAVGARFAIAGPPPGSADRELGARHYAELLEIGRSYGVRPAFEYLGFVGDINTLEDALDIVDRCGDPDASVVIDPFHCWRGGGMISSLTKLHPEQIAISHFNDCPAAPAANMLCDEDRVLPGDGVVDLHAWCAHLTAIGYRGYLSLELFRDDLWQRDPFEVARIGLERMRQVAEQHPEGQ
jgi:sugar phosphate isomerase/epimerase